MHRELIQRSASSDFGLREAGLAATRQRWMAFGLPPLHGYRQQLRTPDTDLLLAFSHFVPFQRYFMPSFRLMPQNMRKSRGVGLVLEA